MPISVNTLYETLVTTAASLFGDVLSVLHGQQPSSSLAFEISTLDYPKDPQVDIVFVHGLRNNSSDAWSYIDESTGAQVSWPVVELAPRLHTKARILAYSYETDVGTAEYLVSRTLLHQTKRLIEALARRREGSCQRPIIFVCHSLGGIVVKNALVFAKSSSKEEFRDVCDSVYGIVFLGTPHTTSPKALAESLVNILGPKAAEEPFRHELYNRSTTLACNLERFKPLAMGLSIYAIHGTSSLSRHDSGLDKPPGNDRHIYLTVDRDHENLFTFSSRTDQALHLIIDRVDRLCVEAANTTTANTAQEKKAGERRRMDADDEVHDLGTGKALKTHLKKHPPVLNDAEQKNLTLLEDCFSNWFEDNSSTVDPDAWPIAILQGPPGSGKTQTALGYVSRHRHQYSTILWVNATSRSALEFSFGEIANRMISKYPASAPSLQLLGLDGVDLGDSQEPSRGLNGGSLRLVEQAVMEWLARPHKKKWLLVLDGLSPESGYPISPTWTGWLDQRTPVRHWWREFLTHLPSTTGNRGHIIISTRSETTGLGPPIIPFKSPEESWLETQVTLSVPNRLDTRSKFQEWWQTSEAWEKRSVEVALFLSDVNCPTIPIFLFKRELVSNQDTWTSSPRAFTREKSCLRLDHDFLVEGPLLLYHKDFATDGPFSSGSAWMVPKVKLSTEESESIQQGNKVVIRVLEQVWEALFTGLKTIRSRPDLVIAWDDKEQVVHNTSTLLRWCNSLPDQTVLQQSLGNGHGNLADLAAVCEAHAAYETARKLYGLELERRGEADFTLQLNCARVYQRSGQYSDAEAQYEKIFSSTYSKLFDAPDIKQPVDERITAYRQFALMRASQGRFDEAVEQMSKILALEDPFGDDTDKTQMTESIGELALYLFKSGNEQAASASLQRILASLERTRGRMHPVTLSTMEALSSIKVKTGQIDEARRLLEDVYDCQSKRLGENHPKAVLCRSKIAATMDLGGDAENAEGIFITCLDAARECLGPRHPALFDIRNDFAHCLVTLGEQGRARKELEKLRGEFKSSPGLYSSEVVRRIKRLLACKGDIDYLEVDSDLSTRSTLGVGGFYSGQDVLSDEESDYYSDED